MILGTFRPAYFPSLEYFWQIAQCDEAVFADHLSFSKGSLINRSAPFNDEQTILRIPVLHNRKRLQIFATQIDPKSNWKQKHLKTIHHFFHQWPFSYYYLPELNVIFNEEYGSLGNFLWRLNTKIIQWLHLSVKLARSSELNFDDSAENLIIQWCTQLKAKVYISEAQTFEQGWVKRKLLETKGVQTLTFKPLPSSHLIKNYQLLSILGFLMQFGPEAGYIIRQYLPSRFLQ